MTSPTLQTSAWLDFLEPAGQDAAAVQACRTAIACIADEKLFDGVCWYPSAGTDFRDVDTMTDAWCSTYGFDRPRMFVHTDARFRRPSDIQVSEQRTVLERHEVRFRIEELVRANSDLLLVLRDGDSKDGWAFDSSVGSGCEFGQLILLASRDIDSNGASMFPAVDEFGCESDFDGEEVLGECLEQPPNHSALDPIGADFSLEPIDLGNRWVLMLGRTNWQFLAAALALRLQVGTVWSGDEGLDLGGCEASIGGAAGWFGAIGCRQLVQAEPMTFLRPGEPERADRIGERFMRKPVPYRAFSHPARMDWQPSASVPPSDDVVGQLLARGGEGTEAAFPRNAQELSRIFQLEPISAMLLDWMCEQRLEGQLEGHWLEDALAELNRRHP